ncbi:collagen-like protein [Cupriavidus gilardii J11]|uniref:Collagen-like protein n=1 Tax=Cupriavidus gilardii J11 TaxID=936133 RepID=A0A562BA22_9BURK|nr:collagen-like triple helix repeat-containing protein [Cupriavidus gilardii]TWG81809.1 collagen-like protein [Cupriavidus gilardii J11]
MTSTTTRTTTGSALLMVLLALGGCATGAGSTTAGTGSETYDPLPVSEIGAGTKDAAGGNQGNGGNTAGGGQHAGGGGTGGGSGEGSGGTGGDGGGTGGGGGAPLVLSPTGQTAHETGNIVKGVADVLGGAGSQLRDANLPLVSDRTQSGLGGAVISIGKAVDRLGDGLQNGLGSMPHVDNPVGITVGSTSGAVGKIGAAVTQLGSAVSGVGSGPLTPLAPVTHTVGTTVMAVGGGVDRVGDKLGAVLASAPVQQLTGTVSKAIVPLTSQVTSATQTLGAATGLGQPANQLLAKVGGVLAHGGAKLQQSPMPTVAGVGGVVAGAGSTVAALGGAVRGGDGHGGQPGGGAVAGVLHGVTSTLGGVSAGVVAGVGVGAGVSVGQGGGRPGHGGGHHDGHGSGAAGGLVGGVLGGVGAVLGGRR